MIRQFAITPSEEELSALDRDLYFYEVDQDSPETLSTAQLDDFNRQGYIAPIRIFSESEISSIRTYFDDLLARTIAAGGDSYSISSAHLRCGPVYDLLTDRRIVDCMADLLGENVIAWGSHFFCKMPRDGKSVAWHQDASYWPLSPSKAATAWLAIDDSDRENACMKFVAGSHRFGHTTYRPSDPSEHSVLSQAVDNPEQFGRIVFDELKAGEISIHSDLLLHGSEGNLSARRRCGLTLRYCSADVRAELGWNSKGVYARGSDPSGHWFNNPRPV